MSSVLAECPLGTRSHGVWCFWWESPTREHPDTPEGSGLLLPALLGWAVRLLERRGGENLLGFEGLFQPSYRCRLNICSGLSSDVLRSLEPPFTQVKGELTCPTPQQRGSRTFQLRKRLG